MTMKTEVEIANEVMQGKWEFGDDRKRRITAAGYDYNAIQAIVNRIIATGKPVKEVTVSMKDNSGLVVYVEV